MARFDKFELSLTPAQAADAAEVKRRALQKAGRKQGIVVVLQRSIDARRGQPRVRLLVEISDTPRPPESPLMASVPKSLGARVVIVGAGPAGYFAALELLRLGLCPIVLERGKDVRSRRYDIRALMQDGVVNPHSNYCFGEGGAGTYSDGKLYTRSDKRGNVKQVLQLLVEHGARSDILIDSHPHIGSNRLPGVVENLRQSILAHGGEVHFGQHVTSLLIEEGRIRGVGTVLGEEWAAQAVVLATGHSARDVFEMLHRQKISLEIKPFAIGVRVEHSQQTIDTLQYRQHPRDLCLPASSYRLVSQTEEGGVWSFCMCPGGIIVPSATAPGEIVVNGMSMSGRNSRWANSGIVTPVTDEDLQPFAQLGPLAGLEFQRQIEQRAFQAVGDGSQRAPAQSLADFLTSPRQGPLARSSYVPGLSPVPLAPVLGPRLYRALVAGFQDFGEKMPGFLSEEAIVRSGESDQFSCTRAAQ
jgi:uncharacterized FAD-dependent dehydrogenase